MGIPLKPSTDTGRLSAELRGAWNLKPYWGKPAVGFWGRLDVPGAGWAHFEMRGIATGP